MRLDTNVRDLRNNVRNLRYVCLTLTIMCNQKTTFFIVKLSVLVSFFGFYVLRN